MNVLGKNRNNAGGARLSRSRGTCGARLAVVALAGAMVLAACGKPPNLINRYVLNYPPPAVAKLTPLDTAIKVATFSADQTINRPEMIYKVNPYKTGVYQYNRWRTDPAYLATDYLTRDFRDSGLFKAVYSSDNSGKARFHLEGGVVDFQENDEPPPWHAALTLNITLLDTDQENVADKVMFQRNYHAQEVMPARTPEGLAEAMSTAMGQVSKKIVHDVYQAIKQRLSAAKRSPEE
jgi:ABC-type uncharacterized transport system auxiliary subunit